MNFADKKTVEKLRNQTNDELCEAATAFLLFFSTGIFGRHRGLICRRSTAKLLCRVQLLCAEMVAKQNFSAHVHDRTAVFYTACVHTNKEAGIREELKHFRRFAATGNPFSDLGDEPVFNKFICDLHDGRNAETRQTSDLRAVDLIVRQQNSHDGGFVVGSK